MVSLAYGVRELYLLMIEKPLCLDNILVILVFPYSIIYFGVIFYKVVSCTSPPITIISSTHAKKC